MLTIVLLGYTSHSCHWLRLPRAPSRGVGVDQEVGRRSERLPHRGLAARHTAPGRASQGKWVLSEQKGPHALQVRSHATLAYYYYLPTAQAVYNLWVAVAFMWGWAAAIIIIGLPLYEHRSAVNNGPFLSSARARLLCLDCYACARRLCLPRAGLTDLSDMILPGRGGRSGTGRSGTASGEPPPQPPFPPLVALQEPHDLPRGAHMQHQDERTREQEGQVGQGRDARGR